MTLAIISEVSAEDPSFHKIREAYEVLGVAGLGTDASEIGMCSARRKQSELLCMRRC